MTYLEAINQYWRVNDERLGINEAGLYFALVDVANKNKWSPIFSVSNDVLCMKLSISDKTFRRSRQTLIDVGLIGIEKKGVSKSTTTYKFLSGNFTDKMTDKTPDKTPDKMTDKTPDLRGDNRGVNNLPPKEDNQDAKSERACAHAHTHEEEPTAFERKFDEISKTLLGYAGDIWREEMQRTHGVTDFELAFEQFKSYIVQNALENVIDGQGNFRRYFNWRAENFLKESSQEPPIEYFAKIEKLSDTKWVVHQYGGIDPIPVGTPDPPSPYHAWTGTQWEHI